MNWIHKHSFLVGFALNAAGLLYGLLKYSAPRRRIIRFPLLAIMTFIGAVILWGILTFPFTAQRLDTTSVEVLALIYCMSFGVLAGRYFAKLAVPNSHQRGTLLDAVTNRIQATPNEPKGLTLAGLPLAPVDELKHFKLIGTTGTGKSTAIRELLAGALDRGDRAVIADPDGSYLDRFYDPSRCDAILNPLDARSARWDLFAEMQTLYDADQLARSLIADTEGAERNWRDYARVFLTSLLRQLHRVQHHDPAELYQLLCVTPVDDLRDLLNDTPAGPYLAQDNGRFFGAVRAVANTHLGALEHVARQTNGHPLSVREWVNGGRGRQGGVLFLPYRANEIATLRGLISTWMRLAIFQAMSQSEGDQRLWFIVDELDALGPIDGLKDALARLRKFGGRCVLGFQSIAQVSGTYGSAEAQTIVENCGNTLILRCSASEGGGTARFASRLIGEREVIREQVTRGHHSGPTFGSRSNSVSSSEHYITESAVLPSEIEQLPDLSGYLKFASTPQWRRVNLSIAS